MSQSALKHCDFSRHLWKCDARGETYSITELAVKLLGRPMSIKIVSKPLNSNSTYLLRNRKYLVMIRSSGCDRTQGCFSGGQFDVNTIAP